ncbi:hypothetical protein ABH926_004975 [Catenulispora sp. GP43]|uniref:DUF4232 domain-containing protein n=1 Tax=Catenulispora sp. GP43 TaxID=3156263 RepID=UPI0035121365
MHRFSQSAGALTAVAAVAAVSVLTMAGCDSGGKIVGGSGPGGGSGGDMVSTAAGAADPAQCGGLAEKLVPLHGAASGTTFSDLVVTNNHGTTCTLPAQPELTYLDAHRQPLPVGFSSDPQLKPYTLESGDSATMVIGYGSDGDGVCVAISAVRVTPPGDVLPFTGRTHCANDSVYEEGWVAGTYAAPH